MYWTVVFRYGRQRDRVPLRTGTVQVQVQVQAGRTSTGRRLVSEAHGSAGVLLAMAYHARGRQEQGAALAVRLRLLRETFLRTCSILHAAAHAQLALAAAARQLAHHGPRHEPVHHPHEARRQASCGGCLILISLNPPYKFYRVTVHLWMWILRRTKTISEKK